MTFPAVESDHGRDAAIEIVQAYLQLNGFLTAARVPVFRGAGGSGRHAIDVVALRLPEPHGGRVQEPTSRSALDAITGGPANLLVCDVVRGRAMLRGGARDPGGLAAVLTRWGGLTRLSSSRAAEKLLSTGSVALDGCRVALVVFGDAVSPAHPDFAAVDFATVIDFLEQYLAEHVGWPGAMALRTHLAAWAEPLR